MEIKGQIEEENDGALVLCSLLLNLLSLWSVKMNSLLMTEKERNK